MPPNGKSPRQQVYFAGCDSAIASSSRLHLSSRHVFFIPGNPGCIPYYAEFLSCLHRNLCADIGITRHGDFDVYGTSLEGFVDSADGDEPVAVGSPDGRVTGLQGQIEYIEQRLAEYLRRRRQELGTMERPLQIVLIGHSVGAFIGLEVIRRGGERARASEGKAKMEERVHPAILVEDQEVEVLGYAALWPSVTHIGQSSNGQKATASGNFRGKLSNVSS